MKESQELAKKGGILQYIINTQIDTAEELKLKEYQEIYEERIKILQNELLED